MYTARHAIFLLLCAFGPALASASAQAAAPRVVSPLPACEPSSRAVWNDCQAAVTLKGGQRYIGEFRDGRREGFGEMQSESGARYVGYFRNGQAEGLGSYVFPSGARYVGYFKAGRRDGEGIFYAADGSSRASGRWVADALSDRYEIDPSTFPFESADALGVQRAQAGDPQVAAQADERARTEQLARQERERQQALERAREEEREALAQRERERIAAERAAAERAETERLAQLRAQEQAQAKAAADALKIAEAKQRQEEALRLAAAAAPPPSKISPGKIAERRVALVVGNSAYRSKPLDNPANDATDVAAALQELGFKVSLLLDANLARMRAATREFEKLVAGSDVALIFYAGHGIEYRNSNYMIPVDADPRRPYELEDTAYNANRWLEMLEMTASQNAQRVNIVILDACRDASFARSWNSRSVGLAKMDAPTGTILVYSTAPGKVASDGTAGQRNSPFTRHLLSAIQEPNLTIEQVLKETRRRVVSETRGEQVPWEHSSLVGDFIFRRER